MAMSEPNQVDTNETTVSVTCLYRFGASAQFEFDSILFRYFSFVFSSQFFVGDNFPARVSMIRCFYLYAVLFLL